MTALWIGLAALAVLALVVYLDNRNKADEAPPGTPHADPKPEEPPKPQ